MNLFVYGAGATGCEVMELAIECNSKSRRWSHFYYIDDINFDRRLHGISVISYSNAIDISGQKEAVVGIGEPSLRYTFRRKFENDGVPLATLIHPSAFVSKHAVVESGAIIFNGCCVSTEAQIKKNALVHFLSIVGHNTVIGEDAIISISATLSGNVSVGNRSYLGASTVVREKLKVGEDTIVGMGSMVLNDIPDGVVAYGTPSKVMKSNDSKMIFH